MLPEATSIPRRCTPPRDLLRRRPYLVAGGSEATETAMTLERQYQLARGDAGRYTSVHQENLEARSSP
jgi:adenosylmethionine-8-amino-7-oxononanoate aminotransferase